MRSLMICESCELEETEDEAEKKMVDNFRPPLPLGERTVRKCC